MHRSLVKATMEATIHLLLAGGLLVAASLAGLGGSFVTLALAVLLAIGLYVARGRSTEFGRLGRVDVDAVVGTAWVAPALAAVTTLVAWGVTPGELQALGGLLGLTGMANYFLRPVYLGVLDAVSSARSNASADRR